MMIIIIIIIIIIVIIIIGRFGVHWSFKNDSDIKMFLEFTQ